MRITLSVDNTNYDQELKELQEGKGEGIKPWKTRTKVIETGLIDGSTLAAPVGEKIAYIDIADLRLKNRRDVENLMKFLENCKLGIEKGPMKFERVKNLGKDMEIADFEEDVEPYRPTAYAKRAYSDSGISEERRSTNDV